MTDPNLKQSLADAIKYADDQGIDIPPDLYLRAYRAGAIKAETSINRIAAKYNEGITKALTDYFNGANMTASRNAFKRATTEAFVNAFDLGWIDGGQDLPLDKDALAWFNSRIEQEFAYIDTVFQQAKDFRKDDDFDFKSWIEDRASAYAKTLLSIYNAARMWANKSQMLTWFLGETEQHCITCAKLNGGKHRASWYLARDYIPRKPGAAMKCGGYNCDCKLKDKNGKEITL